MAIEKDLCRRALAAWSNSRNIVLLGNTSVPRLPIFSFLIKDPCSGMFLHHNYVCALLNDVFGIQARGGCACAGPYAQNLLGIDEKLAKKIEDLLLEDSRLDRVHLRRYHEYSEREILRPGFVRLNLPYFMSHAAVEFVLKAVEMVAKHGWMLLPQYMFNPETGEWKHRKHQVFRDRKWLGSISYSEGHMTYPSSLGITKEPSGSYMECLLEAEEIFRKAATDKLVNSVGDQTLLFGEEGERYRWFLLPSEVAQLLGGKSPAHFPMTPPFSPPHWNNVPEGADSCCAKCLEPCNGNYVSPMEKYTLKSPENLVSREENDSDVKGVVDCTSVSGQVNGANMDDSLLNSCNYGNITEKDISTLLCTDEILDSAASFCVNSGQADTCYSTKFEARSVDTKHGVNTVLEEGTHGVESFGDDSIVITREEKSPESSVTNDSEQSNKLHKKLVESLVDNLEMKTVFENAGLNSVAESSSASELISGNGDASASSKTVCQRKGRKNKQKEVVTGKPQFHHPPKSIFKPTLEALEEYDMIHDGDRVMVCLSGGKDSLSLLHALRQYQFYSRSKGINFELGAATVDPQSQGYDPKPLVQYLAALAVPYFFEEQGIIQQAAQLTVCESICSFCSRMKRGRLYACARRGGYNVLAMGQHLDDLAESFLMSAFHNGLLRTMKANYTVLEGDLRVIRPLVYVREKELRNFAEKVKLPVIAENCPACFEVPKERHRTKQLLAAQEILFPGLYHSLLTAMKPLMARDRVGLESSKMKEGNYEDFL